MALPEETYRLIRSLERGLITWTEFFGKLFTHLLQLPPAERQAAIEELSAHPNEEVCAAARDCRGLIHHVELSQSLEYIQRNSPLKPGTLIELFGGYDWAYQGKPRWLNGRKCYRATFLRFVPCGENTIPLGLVEFDDPVELLGHNGRFAVLRGSYGSDSFAWGQPEGVVEVHVMEALPEDLSSIRSHFTLATATETHAIYRVKGARTAQEPKSEAP